MKEFIDSENNYRFFTDKKQVELLYDIAAKIKEHLFSNDQVVSLLKDVDAEIAHDILKILMSQKYISKDDYDEIDTKLIKLYELDFISDFESGNIENRVFLKANKNKRLISRYEILGIYFSKTLDSRALFGFRSGQDPLINNLALVNQRLCVPRVANALAAKQEQLLSAGLPFIYEYFNSLNKASLQ